MKNLPVILGIGSIALIGLGLFSLGTRNLWRAFASYSWPTSPATVVESFTEVAADNRRTESQGDTRSTTYAAKIKFQYEVRGRIYSTDQIYIGQTVGSGDSSEAELRRFRYPLGAKVPVCYNPSDPSIASVHPGFQAEVLWLPGAGLAFLVPAVMAFFLYRSMFEGSSSMGAGLTIFCAIFMTIGSILLFIGGRSLWSGWRSSDWPTTRGVIVFGHRDESQETIQVERDERSYSNTGNRAAIIFSFEVDGRLHFSNNRRFGQLAASDSAWADSIAEKYRLGRHVTVWYRPDNPDVATLEPGVSKEALWAPGAGAAFLLFGLAGLIFGVPALGGELKP